MKPYHPWNFLHICGICLPIHCVRGKILTMMLSNLVLICALNVCFNFRYITLLDGLWTSLGALCQLGNYCGNFWAAIGTTCLRLSLLMIANLTCHNHQHRVVVSCVVPRSLLHWIRSWVGDLQFQITHDLQITFILISLSYTLRSQAFMVPTGSFIDDNSSKRFVDGKLCAAAYPI